LRYRFSPHVDAFTLVELLVVVSIIALLVAILLPSLRGARDQAKMTACLSNMRQMGVASAMYADDNQDFYPMTAHGSQLGVWVRTLQPYVGNTLVYRCPADRSTDWYSAQDSPAQQLLNDRRASFAINIYFSPELEPPLGAPDPTPLYGFIRRGKVARPAATVHYAELIDTEGFKSFADHIHADQWLPNPLTGMATSKPEESVAEKRHRGKSNYTFADGHAETLVFKQTFELDETGEKALVDQWNPRGYQHEEGVSP
jgi:prepilin-type processing-associated H-X9-DG protein/prepilin-type N-terminal cleavage/methylation domain-containing protein